MSFDIFSSYKFFFVHASKKFVVLNARSSSGRLLLWDALWSPSRNKTDIYKPPQVIEVCEPKMFNVLVQPRTSYRCSPKLGIWR